MNSVSIVFIVQIDDMAREAFQNPEVSEHIDLMLFESTFTKLHDNDKAKSHRGKIPYYIFLKQLNLPYYYAETYESSFDATLHSTFFIYLGTSSLTSNLYAKSRIQCSTFCIDFGAIFSSAFLCKQIHLSLTMYTPVTHYVFTCQALFGRRSGIPIRHSGALRRHVLVLRWRFFLYILHC